jgi:hypothetical protein
VIAPVLALNLPVFDLRLNASDSPFTFPHPMARRKIAYGWPCEVDAPPPSGQTGDPTTLRVAAGAGRGHAAADGNSRPFSLSATRAASGAPSEGGGLERAA